MRQQEGADRQQVAADYERLLSHDYRERWSLDNDGNRAALTERLRVTEDLCRGVVPARPLLVLDLGCGDLSILPDSFEVTARIGVDLLLARLQDLHRDGDATPTVNADGASLPFASEAFDVVVLSVMMSSVLNGGVRNAVAAEVTRVLRAGGSIIWYDFRSPNPGNRATRPVRRRELRRLFPELECSSRSLTVLPPLSRRLGGRAGTIYPKLARLPILRTHLAAVLKKSAR